MKKIIIVGNGGFAAEIIQYLNDLIGFDRKKDKESNLKILGIVDNYAPKANQESVDGIKFLGKEDDIKESEDNFYLVASGKPAYRKSAYELKKKGKTLTLIHPTALISNNCFIEKVLSPNTIINAKSKIGKCSVINVFHLLGIIQNWRFLCFISVLFN